MKYYIITVPYSEPHVISYFHRTRPGALLKRLKTVTKLYVPEDAVKDPKTFADFVRSVSNDKKIKIKFGNSSVIDKLSLVEYVTLLFDGKEVINHDYKK